MKKLIVFMVLISVGHGAIAQKSKDPAWKKWIAWEIVEGVQGPESVTFDSHTKQIFISHVAGQPTGKDGVGWISRATTEGVVLDQKWISGLNAPKGMRVYHHKLWVSDINEVLGIDIESRQIQDRIAIPGSLFLNDIAIGEDGRVFVSDTLGSRIYVIQDGKASLFMEGPELESPNGLLVRGYKLIVASWGLTTNFDTKVPGRIFSIDLNTKKKSLITKKRFGNLDGLEELPDGSFIVSDWKAGKVFEVSPTGTVKLLLSGFKGSADIALLPQYNLLILPRMMEDLVTAFKLNSVRTRK